MNPLVRYSLFRILIFAATLLALYAIGGLRGVWLLGTSVVVSALVSYLALTRFRHQATDVIARRVEARIERKNAGREESSEDIEDAVVDARDSVGESKSHREQSAEGKS